MGMDGNGNTRKFTLQILVVSLLFLGVYTVLAKAHTPKISLWELLKGVVKLFLGPFGFFNRIPDFVWAVFIDIGLFLILLFLSIGFFAQFSLPVSNIVQRMLAGLYLSMHAARMHGPAVRIQNGKLPTERPRRETSGRGVLILDTASAAVLRRRSEFTRSVGPGLVFTRRGEYVAGSVDLHRVAWPLPPGFGPRGDGEDPFALFDEAKETADAYEQRKNRRYETSGETRDGVEVVPNLFVYSQIDPEDRNNANNLMTPVQGYRKWLIKFMQSEGSTRFGYNPESVRLAVTGELVDPQIPVEDIDRRKAPWYQLPAFLAVDLWREYLRKFTFEELFNELPHFGNQTALQIIQQKVAERLKRPFVAEISPVGQPTGRNIASYEYQVLQSRGIKVLYAPIRNLHVQKQIDQQLEDKWFAYWRWRADNEREYVEQIRSYRAREGKMDALREFAIYASMRFTDDFLAVPRSNKADDHREQMRLALELILRGTLRQCHSDNELHPRLTGEEAQLAGMINWLRQNKSI
jgi:hypothetical protein